MSTILSRTIRIWSSSTVTEYSVGNELREWRPGVFVSVSATKESDQEHKRDGETRWANLAAQARADWSSENPF